MGAQAQTIQAAQSGEAVVREATPQDAESCGRIFYDSFASIATSHNHPVEPSSPEFTRFMAGRMLANAGFTAFVAEHAGEVTGCAFVDERSAIAAVGPVSVDPQAQDGGVGRALMEAILARERARGAAGVRLVQTAYHYRSLALYLKLGFVVREALAVLQGEPPRDSHPGLGVREARLEDVDACERLCLRIHGHERTAELRESIQAGSARVVERPGRLCGYATGFGYGWHAVAETNEDLCALLCAPDAYMGLGVLVPARNSELLRWALERGLRIVQTSTLMTIGLYNEPAGSWLPSIAY